MNPDINIQVEETRFKVPLAYLIYVVASSTPYAGVVIKQDDGMAFGFWMPTKRPEPVKTDPPMLLPELYREGARWGQDEYPVTVLHARYVSSKSKAVLLPSQIEKNLEIGFGGLSSRTEGIADLDKMVYRTNPLVSDYYHTKDDDYLEAEFSCSRDDLPSPTCNGQVLYKESMEAFRIYFPRDKLSEWRTICDASRTLLTGWRVK